MNFILGAQRNAVVYPPWDRVLLRRACWGFVELDFIDTPDGRMRFMTMVSWIARQLEGWYAGREFPLFYRHLLTIEEDVNPDTNEPALLVHYTFWELKPPPFLAIAV